MYVFLYVCIYVLLVPRTEGLAVSRPWHSLFLTYGRGAARDYTAPKFMVIKFMCEWVYGAECEGESVTDLFPRLRMRGAELWWNMFPQLYLLQKRRPFFPADRAACKALSLCCLRFWSVLLFFPFEGLKVFSFSHAIWSFKSFSTSLWSSGEVDFVIALQGTRRLI